MIVCILQDINGRANQKKMPSNAKALQTNVIHFYTYHRRMKGLLIFVKTLVTFTKNPQHPH